MWSKGEDRATSAWKHFRNERGLGIFDTLLVCILVSILIGIVIPYYRGMEREAKESALQTGLAALRKGIELYRLLEGEFPTDLKNLAHARYVIPVREDTFFSGDYLRGQTLDKEGNLLDPFGNRYRYDPKNGAVTSATGGYEDW